MNGERTIRVAVDAGIERLFDYIVPRELEDKIIPGTRVRVPFGSRTVTGYAVGYAGEAPHEGLKPVLSAVDGFPVFSRAMLELALELSQYYVSPPGDVFKAMLPGAGKLRDEGREALPGRVPSATPAWLEPALKRCREGKGGVYVLQGAAAGDLPAVYADLAAGCVNSGKQAVFLFPDSRSLAAHRAIFGEELSGMLAVYHGSLAAARRRFVWEGARSGRFRIILGLRSAVFSPLRNPGLFVVHEEADFSYKSKRTPRFNAVSAALMRGAAENCPVVLGGEFHSLETCRRLQTAEFFRLGPPGARPGRPAVRVIDMRGERAQVFSRQLKQMVYAALDEKRQVILFAGRRGYSNLYLCRGCGHLKRCVNCSVPLRHHASRGRLICHYCHYSEALPEACPVCGEGHLRQAGFGSQKAESLAVKIFRGARVARLDSDSAGKGAEAEAVIADFRKGRTDILIDTGISLDSGMFENAAACGIMSADNLLNMPDFRAAENLFRFVCRAGSSVPESASLALQTYNPGHYVMDCIKSFDKDGFYARESVIRKKLGYPPFSALAAVIISGRNESRTDLAAAGFAAMLREDFAADAEILGPVPAVVSRLRGVHRRQILVKGKTPGGVSEKLKSLTGRARGERLFPGAVITVDVDPVNMI